MKAMSGIEIRSRQIGITEWAFIALCGQKLIKVHYEYASPKNFYMFMISVYYKINSAQLTVVFKKSKSVYSPMVELPVRSSAHKLKYIIITHRHSLWWFVQAFLKYMQLD